MAYFPSNFRKTYIRVLQSPPCLIHTPLVHDSTSLGSTSSVWNLGKSFKCRSIGWAKNCPTPETMRNCRSGKARNKQVGVPDKQSEFWNCHGWCNWNIGFLGESVTFFLRKSRNATCHLLWGTLPRLFRKDSVFFFLT